MLVKVEMTQTSRRSKLYNVDLTILLCRLHSDWMRFQLQVKLTEGRERAYLACSPTFKYKRVGGAGETERGVLFNKQSEAWEKFFMTCHTPTCWVTGLNFLNVLQQRSDAVCLTTKICSIMSEFRQKRLTHGSVCKGAVTTRTQWWRYKQWSRL